MSEPVGTIELTRCGACQAEFLPTDGPCPRCGSTDGHPFPSPASGRVLAATELVHPAHGWESPHRLALVELPGAVRLIAIVDGSLPQLEAIVSVRREGEVYRARAEPGASPPGGSSDGTGLPGAATGGDAPYRQRGAGTAPPPAPTDNG